MKQETLKKRLDLIDELVGYSETKKYIEYPNICRLGVYDDGTVAVGQGVGNEIADDERAFVSVECLGDYVPENDEDAYDCIDILKEDLKRRVKDNFEYDTRYNYNQQA